MNRKVSLLLHVATWMVLFLSPLMFMNHGHGVSFDQYLTTCAVPLSFMVVFYLNYLWLAPRHFVGGQHGLFFTVNAAAVIGLGIGLHLWMTFAHGFNAHPRPVPPLGLSVAFVLRDIFNLVIAAAIATTLQLAFRWQKAEQARQEAELSNLRSQINPHFLLNTLNNIYALTAFDVPKAQECIQDLSKMLRHILYDYQQTEVYLQDEVEFLKNYIRLMRIRLSQAVEVETDFSITNPQQKVAPMIFISLVENAFKHGVSPTLPSVIRIALHADDHQIVCDITNSNHPKNAQDRSGHGIGLELVGRRLELAYKGCYTWDQGVNREDNMYHSTITITL